MKRISWSDHHFFAVGWLWSLMKIDHWVLFTTFFFPLKYWGNVQRLGCQSAAWALWFSIEDCPRDVWKNIMCLHRYMAPLQQTSWVDPIEHEELLKQRNVAVLCFVYDRSSMWFMVWFALFWDLALQSPKVIEWLRRCRWGSWVPTFNMLELWPWMSPPPLRLGGGWGSVVDPEIKLSFVVFN